MKQITFALFGEAEKGQYQTAYHCQNLEQLLEFLGNPPPNSLGIHFAVQALLYERDLIFLRVKEEGFSADDYFYGAELLEKGILIPSISAICAPGVGDPKVVTRISKVCQLYESVLVTSEADLYDYLTG